MIHLDTARELLDFGARIGGGPRAEAQLEGAVALHAILSEHRVAYLADEVGMGKTLVALGAMALFRHFQPGFRVLVLAPRENLQLKWQKELRNFIQHNVRFPDLRVKAIDGRPTRRLVSCSNLLELAREALQAPDRDFFARLTSFSLPLGGDGAVPSEKARRIRDELRRLLPWLPEEAFDLRSKDAFKDNVARALCCTLPVFDLVIVDEGHNLKAGLAAGAASRNRVLSLALGRDEERSTRERFPGYGPRAKRVLFLSATPIEESYTHLYNQLDLFGLGHEFGRLRASDATAEELQALAGRFLIRRVTSLSVAGQPLTKNLYRREWRRGGVARHDEPISMADPRQRLVVALVQKKVSELLGSERFQSSFQIGMLSSFESFLETAKLHRSEEDEANFDDAEQTEDALEREGIDVRDVNRLGRDHRETFGRELPHPKMDALVDALATSWESGRKHLVFVRRVASVRELKRKLDERYDVWLLGRLQRELPESVRPRLEELFARYRRERNAALATGSDATTASEQENPGGSDTFFAWFFRGDGPRGVLSGANVQQRFTAASAAQATFFEDNHVAALLGVPPGGVEPALAAALGVDVDRLCRELSERARAFLGQKKEPERSERFEAFQAAAVQWLHEAAPEPLQQRAKARWHERFQATRRDRPATTIPPLEDELERRTFFTELRRRPELRAALWPESLHADPTRAFREEEQRAQLLSTAVRLGHALVDLYAVTITRLGSLDRGARDASDGIDAFLDRLDAQRLAPDGFRAFEELRALSEHFELLLEVNQPDARDRTLAETGRLFGTLLGRQQPTAGMSGQVNQTVVKQFRMPGYPFVLVTTDLLQEGEDLHTFCADVHHYGLSWTPSSMEQRVGRVDRVRSLTDRRLGAIANAPTGEQLLQVTFPHLAETVEVLQVHRVLERMNTFLRLMHTGLQSAGPERRSLDTGRELLRGPRRVEVIGEVLRSAFPIQPAWLKGEVRALETTREQAESLRDRFRALPTTLDALRVDWETQRVETALVGTAILDRRKQPFTLLLQSIGAQPLVRCISPVGLVEPGSRLESLTKSALRLGASLAARLGRTAKSYDLSVASDVLLTDAIHDAARVGWLVRHVVQQADDLEREQCEGCIPHRDADLLDFRDAAPGLRAMTLARTVISA